MVVRRGRLSGSPGVAPGEPGCTYTRAMNRTRVTEECPPQAAPAACAACAERAGVSSRTVVDGEAPAGGRGALHGHG